ncbi:MAG: hydrogenase maturation protease, partial [Actinobacteria bacterium]
MVTTLVIGIGNVARRDDGVAHSVARAIDAAALSGVRVLTAVGLDVAMAADVAEVGRVVIVDAVRRETPGVAIEPLKPGPAASPTGHTIDAPSLL